MFDERDKPSVTLIGQPNVQQFTLIPLHKREANMIAWIYCTLVETINYRETLVATINKRNTLIKISLYKREHQVTTMLLNEGKYLNLIHISLNKRENQMMKFPINKGEHIQTLL